jgi:hypothetical protein
MIPGRLKDIKAAIKVIMRTVCFIGNSARYFIAIS